MAADEQPDYPPAVKARMEVERLTKQHCWMRTVLKGKIILAPVDLTKSGLRIHDVGCADGILLRDLQKQVANDAELVGSDVTAAFLPEHPQGNIRYLVSDVCQRPAEELVDKFDLTHVRLVLPFTVKVGPDAAVANMVATIVPGGWLQNGEVDYSATQENRPAFNATLKLMGAIMAKAGVSSDVPMVLRSAFEKAGLVNVSTQSVKLPAGALLSNPEDIDNSLLPWKISIPTLIHISSAMGIEHPPELTENLAERFEDEMRTHGAAYTMVFALGQKPSAN